MGPAGPTQSLEKNSGSLPQLDKKWEKKFMKWSLFFILISFETWARPLVLITTFDPFDQATSNNSEKVAALMKEKFKNHPDFDLRICSLSTVFDKSFFQLEQCLKNLKISPSLVLGLGEVNCSLKVETIVRNKDKTFGPDNDGMERNNTAIVTNGPQTIGLNYPLPHMYCSLSLKERSDLVVSNDAGSFVCNNLSYQISYNYPELTFGFIHVPAHHCQNISDKTSRTIEILEKMILASLNVKSFSRLPTTKKELKFLRKKSYEDKCINEFYKKAKGADELIRWPF